MYYLLWYLIDGSINKVENQDLKWLITSNVRSATTGDANRVGVQRLVRIQKDHSFPFSDDFNPSLNIRF